MKEIWEVTQIQIKKFDTDYVFKSRGILIGAWWTLFILSNFVGRYLLKIAFNQETIEQVIESSKVTMFLDVIQVVEALLVIAIVSNLSRMEAKLASAVQSCGGLVLDK